VRRLVAGLALVALAGCGSTVQVSGSASVPDQVASGGPGTTGTSPDLVAPGPSTGTGGTTGGVGSSGAVVGTSTGGASGGTGAATGGAGPIMTGGKIPGAHKGVTDTAVKLGFLYLASGGTVVGAFGVKGYSQGDELGEMRALVADQNERGGLAGRRIELVPRDLGGIDASNWQAACDFFTQDEPVFMVLSALGHSDLFNACVAGRGVGYSSNWLPPPNRLMRDLGSIYGPDDMSAERFVVLLARSMVSSGLVPRGAKVGVYRSDTPDYARLTRDVLKPLLAQAGVQVVAEEAYDPNDSGGSIAAAPSVAFRLRGAGVTHVLAYESPLFLMTAAQSQGWHPFWTVSSRSGPGTFLEGAAPQEQLRNSGGPGWMPVSDLATRRIKGYVSSEEKRCLDTLRKAGHSYEGAPRYVAQMLCGELYHVVRVVARVPELSTKAFQLAAESLPSYPSPMTFSLSFAGGRHDGASSYRIVRYLSSCSCFGYTTPLRPIPTS